MIVEVLPVALMMALSIGFAVSSTMVKSNHVKLNVHKTSEYFLITCLGAGFSLIVVLLLSLFKFTFSWYSVLWGIALGIATSLCTTASSFAVKTGPVSYTQIIINMSTAVTAFSGILFWGQHLRLLTIIGIVIMICCFFLSVDTTNKSNKKASLKWFVLAFVAMISNALIGLIQTSHQSSDHKGEVFVMLLTTFFVDFIFALVLFIISYKKETKRHDQEQITYKNERLNIKSLILTCFICGLASGVNNVFNLYLTGVVDTAIFFPLINGLPLVLIVVLSFIIFKEKLTKKQVVGITLGIIASVLLILGKTVNLPYVI